MNRRVLHIVSGMNRGGVETWIMNVLRRIDTQDIGFDFFVEATDKADYDDEIVSAGGRIHRSPPFRQRGRAALALARVLRQHGPYDVVHAHGRHDMAWPLTVAVGARVPVRIGHVHNVKQSHERTLAQKVYKRAMKRTLSSSATWILGCSNAALESLYGDGAVTRHSRVRMLPYGIDMSAFVRRDSRATIERELEIPPNGRIVGHVGRFVWEKNHPMLIDTFAELAGRDPSWYLLMVGDGRERDAIARKIDLLGLRERVRFTGVRSDVPALISAMDVFVFPSLIEGFGLVMIEAQALGVPCVLGQHLPSELDVHRDIMHRLPLDAGAAAWADAVERATQVSADERQAGIAAAHDSVAASPFNIDRSVSLLLSRYYGFAPRQGRVAPG